MGQGGLSGLQERLIERFAGKHVQHVVPQGVSSAEEKREHLCMAPRGRDVHCTALQDGVADLCGAISPGAAAIALEGQDALLDVLEKALETRNPTLKHESRA